MRVLIVEDERRLADAVARGLRHRAMAVDIAYEELLARVQALGRRPRRALPPVLARRDVELDPARHEVRRRGQPVELQGKEFAVLRALLEAGGGVVSSEELLARVWD